MPYCTECESEYDNRGDYCDNDDCDSGHMVRRLPEDCDCYECVGERTVDGNIVNNVKYHTYGKPCLDECGNTRTKYRDLGRKGYYVCPDCR